MCSDQSELLIGKDSFPGTAAELPEQIDQATEAGDPLREPVGRECGA